MNAGNTAPAGWRHLYRCAMLEANLTRVPGLIAEARAAICERMLDLEPGLPSKEQQTLNDALRFLHILQEEVLRQEQAT